ncbi:hypothetical protein GCM10028805_16160 [Spirosoma harenae]
MSDYAVRLEQMDAATGGVLTQGSSTNSELVYYYKHPDYLGSRRSVSLYIYRKDNPAAIIATRDIQLYQAPAVLVHGLFGGGKTFKLMADKLLEPTIAGESVWHPKSVLAVDYSLTNASSFSTNAPVVPLAIDEVINNLRNAGVAAGKADVVGHSMGGILARLYLQNAAYLDDIHKLITLNTPHSGTQLADYGTDCLLTRVQVFYEPLTKRELFNWALAIPDLQSESPAIRSLNTAPNLNRHMVPSHAIATRVIHTQPYTFLEDLNAGFGLHMAFVYVNCSIDLNTLYGESTHDFIVPQISQLGGLSESHYSLLNNQGHVGSSDNVAVISRVKDLFRQSPTSPSFTLDGFHPVVLPKTNPSALSGKQQGGIPTPTASLSITTPQLGTVVKGGKQVAITVASSGVSDVYLYVGMKQDTAYLAKRSVSGPTTFMLTIDTLSGERDIFAIGIVNGTHYITAYSTVVVNNRYAETIRSGPWIDPTTWLDNQIPAAKFDATIKTGHTITLPANIPAEVRRITAEQNTKLIHTSNSKLVFDSQ